MIEANLLCIETATRNCSVSLISKGEVSVREESSDKYVHAEKLHVFIMDVLKDAGLSTGDLDAVMVSKGPGSYTGLRIGVSAAKGLCYPFEIPLMSMSTNQVLAMGALQDPGPVEGIIISLIDARRMEVYAGVFDSNGNPLEPIRAEIVDEDTFKPYLNAGKVTFVGDGVEKCRSFLDHPNVNIPGLDLPSASWMKDTAIDKFSNKEFEDLAYFEPFYLKDFKAGKPKRLL